MKDNSSAIEATEEWDKQGRSETTEKVRKISKNIAKRLNL